MPPSLGLAWLAWLLIVPAAITLALAGLPARWHELRASAGTATYAEPILALELGLALVFFVTALFVTWKLPKLPMALFLAITLVLLGAVETSLTNALIMPAHSPVAEHWHWPVLFLRALEMISALILLYVFPDGQFVPSWTRPLALIWIGLTLAWLRWPELPFNTLYGPTWRATPVASLLVGVGWFSTGVIALSLRYLREQDPLRRRQTWWVAAGLIAAVLGGMAYYALQVLHFGLGLALLGEAYWVARPALQSLGMALLPLCLAVAMLRYRLFAIELILNRALVHGTLTMFVIGTYIGVVTALAALFRTESLLFSLLATGLVAVLFQPLRARLQRGVDRLIYGARAEPYSVLAGLGHQLAAVRAPEATLSTLVATVATALRLPAVAITQARADTATPEQVLAAYQAVPADATPSLRASAEAFAISYRGQLIGHLLATPRPGESGFRADERRLLSDLARQAGSVLHAHQLTLDLQRSRERLVSAREEERRRMRRDLHDGMGPTLASVAQRIGLATALLPHERERSSQLLAELEDQVRALLVDLRRLVYALRPPALDQYGLTEALRIECERISTPQLQVQLDLPAPLSPLPAAVETAAFRITLEALANLVHHAQAQHGWVSLRHLSASPPWLEVTIRDDGMGLAPDYLAGVGLRSMRERAEEIGGQFELSTPPAGGLCVRALLPLPLEER